jgi:hypothetical protein
MRTTIDIDPSVLDELRRRQRPEHKTLGQLVSELLARALAEDRQTAAAPQPWVAKDLRPRVDLDNKDAVMAILDRE